MKRILLSVFAAAITAAWAIPATAADVSFDGQYRLRGEYRSDNGTFDGSGANLDASNIMQRVRLTASAQATDDTSFKITIQDSRNWGAATSGNGGPNLTDDGSNTLDLHESYVKIDNLFGTPVSAKIGRQKLVYGDQRLIGAFDWHNNARSFDAAKFTFSNDAVDADLIVSKVDENSTPGDDDQDFYGIYATVKSVPNNTVDVYGLLLRDGSTSQITTNNHGAIAGIDGVQNLWTYGFRVKGGLSDIGIDYTGELALQTGTIPTTTGDTDISALAYAIKAGYALPIDMKVRIGAEYVYASGDDDTTDNEIGTFTNLFPTNHLHMGYADQQGWRNISAWSVNAKAQVNEQLSLYVAYWALALAEEGDAWYGAGNWFAAPTTTLRGANSANTTDDIGSEIDLVATYKYNEAVTLQAGYSIFSTGDLIDNRITTPEDQDWAYLQLTANF